MPMPANGQINSLRQGRGLFENALSMLTSAAGEPAAGFAALAELARGGNAGEARDAVRQAFAYQPRTPEGQQQQRMLGEALGYVANSTPVKTWQQGVDIAGRYSPVAGAALQTVPTAIGVAMGAKPALKQGRALSELAESAQRRMVHNAMTPSTINTGPIGMQRGVVIYHGSGEDAPELEVKPIRAGGGFNYGAIFGSSDKKPAESHGKNLYMADIADSDILDGNHASYNMDAGKVKSALDSALDKLGADKNNEMAWDAIVDDVDVGDDALRSIFGDGYDDHEYGLLQQKARALLAKNLGYKAVTTKDEHGTSYMILPGSKLIRSKD